MLSIIIPTLNEEDYLPFLLASIKKQNVTSLKGHSKGEKDYEIIVADAGSKDKTVEIARQYGCVIIEGGLPARGRNNGAKVAKGDLLFFLDADTVIPENFLKNTLEEFHARKLDIASFCLFFNNPKNFYSLVVNIIYNKTILITEKVIAHSAVGILIKKNLFDKLHGFDEDIKLAEDMDLARRAVKQGRFGIVRSTEILVSDRRFKKDGWFKTGVKYFLCELHLIFLGSVKSNVFNYKFNHYKDSEHLKK